MTVTELSCRKASIGISMFAPSRRSLIVQSVKLGFLSSNGASYRQLHPCKSTSHCSPSWPFETLLQEAGWSMASFARAAELLKYTWPGWAAAGVEGPFLAWVNRLMLPALNHEMLQRLPLANWQTTVAGGPCGWVDSVAAGCSGCLPMHGHVKRLKPHSE